MAKPLPAHLVDMTQDKWDRLTERRRAELRDCSELHPELVGLEGKVVHVTPDRGEGCLSTFRVGRSTGWRPVHLAMPKGAIGSSDVISAAERFTTIRVVR